MNENQFEKTYQIKKISDYENVSIFFPNKLKSQFFNGMIS